MQLSGMERYTFSTRQGITLTRQATDVAIIGAGPYGLSIAAHLRARNVAFRIFGTPMSSWRNHMAAGTLLKSFGFASSLYDPGSTFTLAHFCQEQGLPYSAVVDPRKASL
jgi:lysine/ornithine N-monooxygenase